MECPPSFLFLLPKNHRWPMSTLHSHSCTTSLARSPNVCHVAIVKYFLYCPFPPIISPTLLCAAPRRRYPLSLWHCTSTNKSPLILPRGNMVNTSQCCESVLLCIHFGSNSLRTFCPRGKLSMKHHLIYPHFCLSELFPSSGTPAST